MTKPDLYTNRHDLDPTSKQTIQTLTGRIARLNDYIAKTKRELVNATHTRDSLIQQRDALKNESN